MNIKQKVNNVIKKFGDDPLVIAEGLNINIIYSELGKTYAYYVNVLRTKIIVVNKNIPETLLKYVIAHELGHALLHKGSNASYLKANTLFSVDKLERQADTFATELLLNDELLDSYPNYSLYNLADMVGLPRQLVQLKKMPQLNAVAEDDVEYE